MRLQTDPWLVPLDYPTQYCDLAYTLSPILEPRGGKTVECHS